MTPASTTQDGTSLRTCIGGKVKFNHRALHNVISGVVDRLSEFKQDNDTAYGNLGPERVFLTGTNNPVSARVELSPPDSRERGGEKADLRAVGALIYELSTHKPSASLVPPIDEGPPWPEQRLGEKSEDWRRLANDLLDPDIRVGSLEELRERVEELRPSRVTRLRILCGTAGVLLIAAAVFWCLRPDLVKDVIGPGEPPVLEEWLGLCTAECNWFAQFRADANEQRLNRWRQDSWLDSEVAQPLRQAREDNTKLGAGRIIGRPDGDVCAWAKKDGLPRGVQRGRKQVSQASNVVQGIQSAIGSASDRWPKMRRLRAFKQLCEKRGWENTSGEIAGVVEDATRLDIGLAGHLDAVLGFPDPPGEDPISRVAELEEKHRRLLQGANLREAALERATAADARGHHALVDTLEAIDSRVSPADELCRTVSEELNKTDIPGLLELVRTDLSQSKDLAALAKTLTETAGILPAIRSDWQKALDTVKEMGISKSRHRLGDKLDDPPSLTKLAERVEQIGREVEKLHERWETLRTKLRQTGVHGLPGRAGEELEEVAGTSLAPVREKMKSLEATAGDLAERNEALEAVEDVLTKQAGESKIPARFPAYIQNRKELREDDHVRDVAERLAQCEDLGNKLKAFVEGDWQKPEVFARNVFLKNEREIIPIPPDGPVAQTFTTWLEETKGYYWLSELGFPQKRDDWDGKLSDTKGILDKVKKGLQDRSERVRKNHPRVAADYAEVKERESRFPAAIINNQAKVTERAVKELTEEIERVLKAAEDLELPPPGEWWEEITNNQQPWPESPHLNEEWRARRNAILQAGIGLEELEKEGNRAKYETLHAGVSRLERRLGEIADVLPAPLDVKVDRPWQERLRDAALTCRKQRVTAFLAQETGEVPWKDNVPAPMEEYRQPLDGLRKDLTGTHEAILYLVENLRETLQTSELKGDADWQQKLVGAVSQRERGLLEDYVGAAVSKLENGQSLSLGKARQQVQAVSEELSDAVESVRLLLDLAEKLNVTFQPAGEGWQQQLHQGLEQKRQALLTNEANAAAQALQTGKRLSPADTKARVADLSERFNAWQQKLAQTMADCTGLERMLDLQFRWRESDAEDRTIAALYENVFETDPSQAVQLLLAFTPDGSEAADLNDPLTKVQGHLLDLAERAGKRRQVHDAPDAEALVTMVEGEDEAVALCAWRRLGEENISWPLTPAHLREESGWSERITQIHSRLPEDRRAQIDVTAERRRRWEACVANLNSPTDLRTAMTLHEDLGIQPDGQPGWVRWNLLLSEVDSLAESNTETDETAKQLKSIVAQTDALPQQVHQIPQVRGLMEGLKELLDKWEEGEIKAAPEAGPDTVQGADWVRDMSGFPQRLVYRWPKRGHELTFGRVEPPGEDPAYLCTTEVSLDLFIDVADAAGKWQQIKQHLHVGNRWRGPKPWREAAGGIRVARNNAGKLGARGWLTESLPPVPPNFQLYPAGLKVSPPSRQSPLNYISADGARLFAEMLNCSLPRQSWWNAAYATVRDQPAGSWNLRDKSWGSQRSHIKENLEGSWAYVYVEPAAGICPEPDPNGEVHEKDDGTLWFSPVDSGQAGPFYHLVGNVAEFVELPNGRPGVIGGSALSPLERSWTTAVEQGGAGKYSDVGLRLALSSPGDSFRHLLQELLGEKTAWLTAGEAGK